jgi:hypothetical protein
MIDMIQPAGVNLPSPDLKQPGNQAADDRTADAEQRRHPEAEVHPPGQKNRASSPTTKPTMMVPMMPTMPMKRSLPG